MPKNTSDYFVGAWGGPDIGTNTKEPEMKAAEDSIERVEKILADVSTGYKVQVQRLSPGWCKGFLETIDVVDNQPVDMEYLIRTWGGECLRLRVKDPNGKYVGGADIPLYSYPPLKYGKPLKHPADIDEKEPIREVNPFGQMDQILSIFERLRKDPQPQPQQTQQQPLDFGAIGEILRLVMPQTHVNPLSGIDQIVAAAEAFKTLRGVFGEEKSTNILDQEDIWGKVQGLLETYAKIKGTDNQKKVPRIGPPIQNPRQIPPPQSQETPQTGPQSGNGKMTAGSLADLLSTLATQNADLASDALIIALDKMPENVRERVVDNLLSILDGDVDESFDDEDNLMQNSSYNATRADGPEKDSGQ